MSKHTPGPWGHAIEQDGENRSVCVFSLNNSGIICDLGGGGFDERLANARLIAAVPDLLAEVQKLRAVVADALDNMPYLFPAGGSAAALTPERTAWRVKLMAASKSARAAIAKANGEK